MSSRKLSELPLAASTLPSDGTIVISSANDGSKRISLADFIELVGGNIDVIDNLNSTSTTDPLSANQGRVLKGLIDSKPSSSDIPTALSDLTEDSTHRTVTDAEKALWNNPQVEVVDNLESNDGTKALSAKQGKVLKGLEDRGKVYVWEGNLLPDPNDPAFPYKDGDCFIAPNVHDDFGEKDEQTEFYDIQCKYYHPINGGHLVFYNIELDNDYGNGNFYTWDCTTYIELESAPTSTDDFEDYQFALVKVPTRRADYIYTLYTISDQEPFIIEIDSSFIERLNYQQEQDCDYKFVNDKLFPVFPISTLSSDKFYITELDINSISYRMYNNNDVIYHVHKEEIQPSPFPPGPKPEPKPDDGLIHDLPILIDPTDPAIEDEDEDDEEPIIYYYYEAEIVDIKPNNIHSSMEYWSLDYFPCLNDEIYINDWGSIEIYNEGDCLQIQPYYTYCPSNVVIWDSDYYRHPNNYSYIITKVENPMTVPSIDDFREDYDFILKTRSYPWDGHPSVHEGRLFQKKWNENLEDYEVIEIDANICDVYNQCGMARTSKGDYPLLPFELEPNFYYVCVDTNSRFIPHDSNSYNWNRYGLFKIKNNYYNENNYIYEIATNFNVKDSQILDTDTLSCLIDLENEYNETHGQDMKTGTYTFKTHLDDGGGTIYFLPQWEKDTSPLDVRVSLPDPLDFNEGYTFKLVSSLPIAALDPSFAEMIEDAYGLLPYRVHLFSGYKGAYNEYLYVLTDFGSSNGIGTCWLELPINSCSSMPTISDFTDYNFCFYNNNYYYVQNGVVTVYNGIIKKVDFLPKDEDFNNIEKFNIQNGIPSLVYGINSNSDALTYDEVYDGTIYRSKNSNDSLVWMTMNVPELETSLIYKETIDDVRFNFINHTNYDYNSQYKVGELQVPNDDPYNIWRKVFYLSTPITIATNTWETTTIRPLGQKIFSCQCRDQTNNITWGGISAGIDTTDPNNRYVKLYNGNPSSVTIDFVILEFLASNIK